MLQKHELPHANISLLEEKYGKFWSSFVSPFDNAKKVLTNYCVRELLKWTPTMFQRVGKNRTDSNVKIVEQILTDSSLGTVEALLHKINSQVPFYEPNSSLLRRMQFICNKMNLPYSIDIHDKKVSLTLHFESPGVHLQASAKQLKAESPSTSYIATTTTASGLLLDSYKKYKLLEEYNDQQIIKREDNDYKNVTLIRDPQELENNKIYLYVITANGETWFAPQQTSDSTKLTHGGLIRKALGISNGPTPPVIAAGTIMNAKSVKTEKEESKPLTFITLSSGHFAPDSKAYYAACDVLVDKLGERLLHLQVGYSNTHYKSLDIRYGQEVSSEAIKQGRAFKMALMNYMQQSCHDPDNIEVVSVVRKLLLEINPSDKDYDDDAVISFSGHELKLFFQDESLCELFKTYKKFFPEAIQNYNPENSSEYTMNIRV
ncbi:hypothetical protein [Legionella cardiaca]|uniref:Substrate of the Dot/Icm secretion system n=1 Tax=Legionella cardiaca TaxID=1071983 RepID=A0ABY8ATB2_9GAMM|nr:hypothetical protein [Legionella cardiaca]WED43908.1 hypothetical protein PXX05_03745 [Legionella cardiaca]